MKDMAHYLRKNMEEAENIHIVVTSGMRGYFAVMVGTFEDGLQEPIITSEESWNTWAEAVAGASLWSMVTGVPFRPGKPK